MNVDRCISSKLYSLIFPCRRTAPTVRLQVLNVTRKTILASCVEITSNGEERRKGLLGRERLLAGEGLWIVPCEAVHTFGMKFAIDVIYLDRDKKIRKVKMNVPPWRVSACLSAYSTLELAAGTVRGAAAITGDILEFSPAVPLA